jgi:hypothetical protein
VLADGFNVSVEAFEVVDGGSFLLRLHDEAAGGGVHFVPQNTFDFHVIHWSLLVYVANYHSFSDRKSLERMYLLRLTACHHGVTSVEVLADVAT